MCVCLVPGLFSNAPSNSTLTPSNSTLTPSNSTEDPLVTLDFDVVGGGCLRCPMDHLFKLNSSSDVEEHLGIEISPAPMDVLLDVTGRVYYGPALPLRTALPTPGASEQNPETAERKSTRFFLSRRFFVIGGVLVLIIMCIIMCVCLLPGLPLPPSNSTLIPSNSTLTPSNSTEDPLVTLDFDEVGGGCFFSNDISF